MTLILNIDVYLGNLSLLVDNESLSPVEMEHGGAYRHLSMAMGEFNLNANDMLPNDI